MLSRILMIDVSLKWNERQIYNLGPASAPRKTAWDTVSLNRPRTDLTARDPWAWGDSGIHAVTVSP